MSTSSQSGLETVVSVHGLDIELVRGGRRIVSDFSLELAAGEIVALVGESGSGKTTAATALLGYVRRGARIVSGEVDIAGVDVRAKSEGELRRLYGSLIAYMPQDPAAALNPGLRIDEQLREVFTSHDVALDATEIEERVAAGLREVRLPDDPTFRKRYPHQLSGGQQQRVYLAMMFLLEPRVIVLDEPTTGLDVTTQVAVLHAVRDLCKRHGTGAVYVSHDLAVVRHLAQRAMIMKDGEVVETGTCDDVFQRPQHPYTRMLLGAVPDIGRPGTTRGVTAEPEPGVPARILAADNLVAWHGRTQALHGVSLSVARGECVALVGESGSGKSTLSRAVIGLHHDHSGATVFDGEALAASARRRTPEQRRRMQYVFQSPFNSLNPRRTVGASIEAALRQFYDLGAADRRTRVESLLTRVALPAAVKDRYPDELSGGERQRVAIARALAADPDVLLCDEITSALDVSVQASIVELLSGLQDDGLAMLFVTHNLGLVRSIAQRVYVLQRGVLVESGEVEQVITSPESDYTRQLIADTPSLMGSDDDPMPVTSVGDVRGR